MTTPHRGDELVMIMNRRGQTETVYYWGKDEDDIVGRWIFVVFPGTQHIARVSRRWVRFVRHRHKVKECK